MLARPKNNDFHFNSEISDYAWFTIEDALNRDDIKESYKKALNKIKNILQK